MRMGRRLALICLCAGLVSACSGGSGASGVSVRPAPVGAKAVPAPRIQREEGLESVIGKGAQTLIRQFGKARIDLSEGDARKLQFISANCVLDVFLYPAARGAAPAATHVEARQRVGGAKTDRAQCIDEVERMGRRK